MKHAYLLRVENAVRGFELLELTPEEKVEVAGELKRIISYPCFFFGINKECFPCRYINDPDAMACVKCGALFMCEECKEMDGGKVWRCRHAAGVKQPTIYYQPKRTLRQTVHEDQEDNEPARPKRERFVLSEE